MIKNQNFAIVNSKIYSDDRKGHKTAQITLCLDKYTRVLWLVRLVSFDQNPENLNGIRWVRVSFAKRSLSHKLYVPYNFKGTFAVEENLNDSRA